MREGSSRDIQRRSQGSAESTSGRCSQDCKVFCFYRGIRYPVKLWRGQVLKTSQMLKVKQAPFPIYKGDMIQIQSIKALHEI